MKKKLFAMVLAAAMSLSLGAITAHGYADDKDIVNDEAVAVMSAVGVLAGTEDGTNFAPKDELDRASAAKIITYLAVGPTAADSMKASDAPFDDVPASHWAAGFIAYCKTSGIIAGDGSGKFNPSDKVKTNEFAKMLLTVLGYDANIEGMTGAQWSVNTSKLASANDLYDDITKGVSENLIREEAAQLAFNTLLADTYEYESKGTQIDLGSGSVNIGATPAKAVENTKNDYKLSIGTKPNANAGQDTTMQLVEKLYGEKFKKVSSGINDDFGRPGYKYTYDSKSVWNGSEDSLLTYNKKRSNKVSDVSTDLKNAGMNVTVANDVYTLKNSNNTGSAYAKLFLNGEEHATSNTDNLATLLALSKAPGKETEIFAKDGEVTSVTVTEYTVGKVDSVSELKDSSGKAYTQYILVAGDGAEGGDYKPAVDGAAVEGPTLKAYADSSQKDNNAILHGEVKKDDVVTYVKVHDQDNDKDVWHVYPTTVVKGKQTGYSSSDGESTINDKTYKWGTGVLGFNSAEAQNNSDDERNFYIDKNGYLVKCDEAADSSDYAYVKDIAKSGKNAEATLVFPDGTSKDVKVTSLKLKGNKDNQLDSINSDDDTTSWNGFYTYSKSGEDYKLTSLDNGETSANKDTDNGFSRGNSAYDKDTIIEKKKSALANGLATIGSNTKVIVYDGDAYTVYSGGLSNMPTITRKATKQGATAEVYCVMEKDGQNVGSKAKLVYIEVKTSEWDIEDSSTKEYFYIYTTDAPSSTRVNGDDFYTYTVASDGGTKKITFNSDVKDTMEAEAKPMYRITRTDKDGNITGVSAVEEGKNVIVLTGDDTSKIEDITSESISFGQNQVGTDKVTSVSVTDQTVVTRIQGKEVNGGTGGGNLSSVKSYVKKDESTGKNKIKALYVFCNSDGDAEKVYVVLA